MALNLATMTNLTPLERLIEHYGTAAALAEALGISPAAVSQWDEIPEGRAYQIEVLTRGKFKARDLMPKKVGNGE